MRTLVKSICENCSITFELRASDKARGRGRFCSKSCASSGPNNSSYLHGELLGGISKEYRTWIGIRRRTTDPSEENYKYYGARGIRVCDRWYSSFNNFLEDMGRAPTKKHSIDRIDGNKNYEPTNCRWATRNQQMSNIRSNKWITFNGVTLTQAEWGRATGLGGVTILKRLKRGWSTEDALTKPIIGTNNTYLT